MESYLMIARSVTYAQRMQVILSRIGIRCQIFRAPRELSDHGCAYAVRIPGNRLTTALIALKQAGLTPIKIYLTREDGYQEAAL